MGEIYLGYNKQNKFFILLFFISLLLLSSIITPVLADDPYKPYLHEAKVPEHPKVKLYGTYTTNLFPGAATYSYPIEVPRGTNGLQPTISISYNSQSVKHRPSVLGAGWSLTQNYIYRYVNGTVDNTADDEFKLVFSGASHDLIYNSNDTYHTKIETFLRMQNFSGGSNTYGGYWTVTSKDGTQFRFGYNSDSELTSNTGRNYALRWSLDQAEDTHGNKIYYSYLEDPYPEDIGTSYLSQILYNNDQKRKINFIYESSVRPDLRFVYDQGNKLNETRRLSAINVSVDNKLVRRYNFEYVNLNPENTLSSLSKIKFIGSDNNSILNQVSFDYYDAAINFTKQTGFWIPPTFFSVDNGDKGSITVDLNNDGFIDLIRADGSVPTKNVWINNRTNWTELNDWVSPEYFVFTNNVDNGVRFIDFNNDGFVDMLQGTDDGNKKQAWINSGTSWVNVSSQWAPPIFFVVGQVDAGVQLVDFNGDGRVDLLQSNSNQQSTYSAYLNNGSGWVDVSSQWRSPTYFMRSSADTGARTIDLNGDGLIDIIEGGHRESVIKNAWLNNGTGWVNSSIWDPPIVFINTSGSKPDNAVRLVDLNGDGLVDMLEDYSNGTTTERGAWINNGNGWTQNNSWSSPEPFTKDGRNIGRRLADVNGDGFADIIVSHKEGQVGVSEFQYTWVKNVTTSFMLKSITNEFGGVTSVNYQQSTLFNNNGTDTLSDLGFNVWVVKNVTQNNSMSNAFNMIGLYSYNYTNGSYDYNDFEFRGFERVNETSPDNNVVVHYFYQDDARKGKEFRTEAYNTSAKNIFSKDESVFNVSNSSNYKVLLMSQTSYLHDGVSASPKVTNVSYWYDDYGNVVERVLHGDTTVSGDEKYERYFYINNTSAYIVDKVSWYQLFAADNVTRVRDVKYSYDGKSYGGAPTKGDLTEVETWINLYAGGRHVVKYIYDSFGNVIRETDPLGRETEYRYGLRDVTFTYPDKVTNALDHVIDFKYDLGTGNLLWQKKNDIYTYFYYDTFGRIIKEVEPFDSYELPTKNYTYTFDGTAPESIKVSTRTSANKTYDTYFYYDGFANLVQLKRPSDGNQQIVKNIFYDDLGRVSNESNPYFGLSSTSLSTPSSTVNRTVYTYDPLSRVIRVTNPDGSNKTINFDHRTITAYDENGHRKAYVLDGHNRIINVLEYSNDPVLGFNFEVDTYNTTYAYDISDNLVNITDTLGNIYTFTYDSLGRRIALSDPDLGNWTYTYDLVGNLIVQKQVGGGNLISGDGFYREYDGLNQLIRIRNDSSANSGQIENYTYDPFGQRIKIMRNDSAKTIIYTPFKDFMRIKNTTGTFDFTYIYQDDTLVARVDSKNNKTFYHPDHLGSTVLITNASGRIVENTFYSPFGEILSGGKADVKLYTGQFKDFPCEYYYGARYYNPCTGRFIQPDQTIPDIYDPQSLNRYSYAYNNPYKYTDPTGQLSTLVLQIIVAIQRFVLIPLIEALSDPTYTAIAYETTEECVDQGSCKNLGITLAIPPVGKIISAGASKLLTQIESKLSPEFKVTIENFKARISGTESTIKGTSTSSKPIIESNIRTFKGNFELTDHAKIRMNERQLSSTAVKSVIENTRGFQYFHEGQWKTGYYDEGTKTFVATVEDKILTVINNVERQYIENLKVGGS